MRRICFVVFALLVVLLAFPAASSAQIAVGVSIRIGPPALPVYAQPICPGPGYMWTPGYWAYGPDGYYWVPGTWVVAPAVGLLWTPGYWGWRGGFYYWHAGYWGPHVGFYGGINYGFGYGGVGFVGGYWHGGVFAYNTAVMHVNTTVIHNTYVNNTVVNNVTVNHVAYNGGPNGVTAQPTAAERAAENEHHIAATEAQTQHEHMASTNRAMLYSANHGRPSVAATGKPGEFSGHNVMAAKAAGGTYHPFTPPSHNAEVHGNTGNTHNFTPPSHNQPAVKSNNNPSSKGNGNQSQYKQAQVHHEGGGQGGKGSNPPPRDHKPDKQEKPH
jgi:WXXGXW repeat (2 copies)